MLTKLGERRGIGLTIRKGLPLAVSAECAAAAAAVVAVDALIGGLVHRRHVDPVRSKASGSPDRRTPTTCRAVRSAAVLRAGPCRHPPDILQLLVLPAGV